jgi:mannitol 2-dehydrogenase
LSDDVHAWELYKLRLLNAGHSCMAYLCALAGLTLVHEALAEPAVAHYLERFLADEAIPSLRPIEGHTREAYAATVLLRFANPGVRDQVARLCIDGSAKFPTFLVPTIAYQLEVGGPVARAALALAGWARYLAWTPVDDQAVDASGAAARSFAIAALDAPERFLDFDAVFPAALRDDPRFRATFAAAARAIDERGALGALAMPDEPGTSATV